MPCQSVIRGIEVKALSDVGHTENESYLRQGDTDACVRISHSSLGSGSELQRLTSVQ